MLRLSRHLTTALLWLAIALLPLRGGIAAAMPHAMGDASPIDVSQPAHETAVAAMSAACDEAAAHTAHAAGDEHAAGAHTCSLCTLCHASAAAASATALHIAALPGGAPPVLASRDIVGAEFDTPERPPRLLA